jgi:hypothetical protein
VTQPTRVLILRTSRFVDQAVAFARAEWPGAEIRVVRHSGHITAAALLGSSWGWTALRWRPHHLVVQWWTPDGAAHEVLDRAALLLQPRGFHVVLEDQSRIWVPAHRVLSRQLRRVGRRLAGGAMVLVIVAATGVLWPATAWRRHLHRRRVAATQ